MTRAETITWLENKLAGKYGPLEPAEHKRLTNRLKFAKARTKCHTRSTGFFSPSQWAAMRKRRRAAQASKRRNRRG